jgi:mono/diheme cytochrome c family protein
VAAGDLQSPNPSAPPFQRVADTPGMTRLALSAWLHSAHPSMPSFVVEDEQIDNLHAYLSSIASR